MSPLTETQKARLHEVADGMLKIYRTLVGMRYLEPSWICEGPHDMSHHHDLYEPLGLDESVTYLYSILPYVDPPVLGRGDFYDRSQFVDFRVAKSVEEARDPMFTGDDESCRPWQTALDRMANGGGVLIYDALRHTITMTDQSYGGSTDPNISKRVEVEEEAPQLQAEEGDQAESREAVQEEEEELDDDDWKRIPARNAKHVLQDIVSWYEDLTETPGRGESTSPEWDEELVRPLYTKHGWPSAAFDGDAFLIDFARAMALRKAEEKLKDLKQWKRWASGTSQSSNAKRKRSISSAGQTDQEAWLRKLEDLKEDVVKKTSQITSTEKEETLRRLSAYEEEDLSLPQEYEVILADLLDAYWIVRIETATLKSKQEQGFSNEQLDRAQGSLAYTQQEFSIVERAHAACREELKGLDPEDYDADREELRCIGPDSYHEPFLKNMEDIIRDEKEVRERIDHFIAQLPSTGAEEAMAEALKWSESFKQPRARDEAGLGKLREIIGI